MKSIIILILFSIPFAIFASDENYQLDIHVHYQKSSDFWKVNYELPIAVNQVSFSRQSNFDRTKLYKIDESKFKWDHEGDVLLIKSVKGDPFTSFDISFSSFYDFIQKDYTHNIKFTDGSVLLYTNHLALDTKAILHNSDRPLGASLKGTRFHFYGPDQSIIFLGENYKEEAYWDLLGEGTYIYFGNIQPVENDNMIAIVDPALPNWAWNKTQQYFPKLFDYYKIKTGQELNFKPVVFFNYDQVTGDYSNYSGGTLDGLVQLTINGRHWNTESKEKFNTLFHFLAHEAAHFWNGQMFSFEDSKHSWMHEGGADTFANFAMMDFGLINYEQMVLKFESAANKCVLNKHDEPLEQSARLGRYHNYYDCGSAMGLASHAAVKAVDSSATVFDVWKEIFAANIDDKTYNQQDYFNALDHLTKSKKLSDAFGKFSTDSDLDNKAEIASWFKHSEILTKNSSDYPSSVMRHWGKQVMYSLMMSHCNSISFSSYDDFVKTYPMEGCKSFARSMEVQYVDGLEIFNDGVNAYNLFKSRCEKGGTVTLQNREKVNVAELHCLEKVKELKPYIKLKTKLLNV